MNPHAPIPDPAASIASYVSGVSISSAVSTGLATPDSTALTRRSGRVPPPISTITSESDVPSSNSATPARRTSPTTVAIAVPGDSEVPIDRYHSAPCDVISGTLAKVSTFDTSVGLLPTTALSSLTLAPEDQPTGGVVANRPRRYGGTVRGSGSPLSMNSSRPVSSPYRYSSGPLTIVIGTEPSRPRSVISCDARSNASICGTNDRFTATNARTAPIVSAAICRPSRTWYGLRASSARSLKLPGSPSAPFATTYRSPTSSPPARIDSHLRPVGKPAPPRPRNPDAVRASTTASGPMVRAARSPAPPSRPLSYSS